MKLSNLSKAATLLGLAITISGVTFKLNHLTGAHTLTNIGVVVLVVGLVSMAGQTLGGRSRKK